MMIFPKNLKIGTHTYQVKYPYIFSNDTLIGQWCSGAGEIRIKERTKAGEMQTETSKLVCLFHEVLHAINYIYCMNNIGKECDSESLIDAISEGLVQVLLDNDLLVIKLEETDNECR